MYCGIQLMAASEVKRPPPVQCGRILTEQEMEKLKKDTKLVSEFQRNKLETEAKRNWDLFYKRNQSNFFKDRHWITREFPELFQPEVSILIYSLA